MDFLIRYGFSIEDIKEMMDTNIVIDSLNDENASMLVDVLNRLEIEKFEIRNILVANPFYLNRNIREIESLILEFSKLNIKDLKTLFEANPFILNMDVKEFKEMISSLEKQGFNKLEIIDYLKYDFI